MKLLNNIIFKSNLMQFIWLKNDESLGNNVIKHAQLVCMHLIKVWLHYH